MRIIKKMQKQKACYWAPVMEHGQPVFDFYGKASFAEPIEIKCRWEDVIKEFTNAQGETLSSMSIVYVDRDVVVGGFLQLGALGSGISDVPQDYVNAHSIKRFDKMPNIKNTELLRTAYL